MGIVLCSCNNENLYSCDDTIDEWVHENLAEIRDMSRATWTTLDEDIKTPVYRAFTNKQRVDFWAKKLEEVLSLDWNEAEKEHIVSAYNFIKINPHFLDGYNILSDEEKNKFDLFFYEWIEKGKTDLHWSMELMYGIVASGNRLIDKQGTLFATVNQTGSRAIVLSTSESKCNCSVSSDWCTPSNVDCEYADCEIVGGCGTFWVSDCDGRCGGI